MKRATSIPGLLLTLLRLRMTRRGAAALALATLAVGAIIARRPPPPAPADLSESLAAQAFMTRTEERRPVAFEPALSATSSGWVVAYARWASRSGAEILVRALDRGGAARGAAARVSGEGRNARYPVLQRCHGAVGLGFASDTEEARWPPAPVFAAVSEDAVVTVPARRVSDAAGLAVSVACDGDGWAVGHHYFSPRYEIERLGPGGEHRAHLELPEAGDGFGDARMTRVGDTLLIAQQRHERRRDRTRLSLRWSTLHGEILRAVTTPWIAGEDGDLRWSARGDRAWLTWGGDQSFGVRHEPFVLRADEPGSVHGPGALGPRRSGDVMAISCDLSSCVAAWTEALGDELARLRTQHLSLDGSPLSEAHTYGGAAYIAMRGRVALARSLDERELLAAWVGESGDGIDVMTLRLNAEGVAQGEPRRISR